MYYHGQWLIAESGNECKAARISVRSRTGGIYIVSDIPTINGGWSQDPSHDRYVDMLGYKYAFRIYSFMEHKLDGYTLSNYKITVLKTPTLYDLL